MARRHKHEEHTNHEAWAIPYGDLVTLLLAFFVVMYAISSVNEGKYRVMSDSLVAAFRGTPMTMQPVQVGEKQVGSGADIEMSIVQQATLQGQPRSMLEPVKINNPDGPGSHYASELQQTPEAVHQLETVAQEVEQAMAGLVDQKLIAVRRHSLWVEVEIRTDILFPSGVATLSPAAVDVLRQLAATLKPFPNPIRVEGHTDNRPISTREFPSNWELSAARAASVVHLFSEAGLNPSRLAVIGLGEFRPARANDTEEGRNANRRVLLVILGGDGAPEGSYADDRGKAAPEAPPAVVPATNVTAQAPAVAPSVLAEAAAVTVPPAGAQ
ncbi:MAG TPA: flagellar motor protein MotD [Steroidobacteraceae bacterium]|jgi:chemotaxis protein MotB